MRIYIESTIPSYVVARPARDLLQAARQQLTRDWWDLQREQHELFTSQVVLDEIAAGERAMAERRLELMSGLSLLISTPDIETLADDVLKSGLLPATADGDAAHHRLRNGYIAHMELPTHRQCRHRWTVAQTRRGARLHPAGNLHAGRTPWSMTQ